MTEENQYPGWKLLLKYYLFIDLVTSLIRTEVEVHLN